MEGETDSASSTGQLSALSPEQERALACLLTHPTVEAAAKASGVGVTTLYRWKRERHAFREAWQGARRDALQSAGHRLGMLAADAVETLRAVLTDDEAKPETRLRAAQISLEMAYRSWEAEDLNDRLAALEAQQASASDVTDDGTEGMVRR